MSIFATILLITGLIFGGAGATTVMAQSSLPDQALYPVKTWSEDLRLELTSNLETKYQLALEFSQKRIHEAQEMVNNNSTPSDSLQMRYQHQMEQALNCALGMPEEQAVQALLRIRQRLEEQQKILAKMGTNANNQQAQAALMRMQTMLQEHLGWVEIGVTNQQQMREQMQHRHQNNPSDETQTPNQGNPWTTGTPVPGSSYGPGPGTEGCTDCKHEGNPWTTGTPVPGSSYGPGPGTEGCTECTPQGNPWTTSTPIPGSGYGPGPGENSSQTCTPGSNNRSGYQPTSIPSDQPSQENPGQQPTQDNPGQQSTPGAKNGGKP